MPDSKTKRQFQFEVATTKPAAIIFADPFLTKILRRFLHRQGLVVKRKPSLVDYVIDVQGNPEAIQLAQRSQAKYLRLTKEVDLSVDLEGINWRLARTNFLLGPGLDPQEPLNQIVIAAIKNQPLTIPFNPQDQIYPLHPQDLAQALWQALVLPNTAQKEFLILGPPVTVQQWVNQIQQLAQNEQPVQFQPHSRLPSYSKSIIEASQNQLHWQPQFSWQETTEAAFQFFWKQIAPEEKQESVSSLSEDVPPVPTILEFPREESLSPESTDNYQETTRETHPEEELIVIEEQESAPEEKQEEKRIQQILDHFQEEPSPSSPDTKHKSRKLPWKWFLVLGGIPLFLIFLFWFRVVFGLVWASRQLYQSLNQMSQQSWSQAEKSSQKAKTGFGQIEFWLKETQLSWAFPFVNQPLTQLAELGHRTALAVQLALPLAENSFNLAEAILKDRSFDFDQGIKTISQQMVQLDWQLSLVEALLESRWSLFPPRWRQASQDWRRKISHLRSGLAKAQKIVPQLPWLVGAQGQRRTFLVLLQNNMELRPTGGFIGSFALITFEDGALINFEVKDVYVADGQLKGHVEPPKQIKEILGEETWYLRDVNWDPDFPKTARNAQWFLRKELGRQVDGVIGFNLEAAKKLIAAFGEVYLADFNEKIDANNLFERAEFWAENEFFPGSTQKMAFLGLLGKQLFEMIKAARAEEYLKIGQAFLAALEEKEILIYLNQPELNQALYQLNWDGRIKTPTCSLQPCFTDYLYLVEANLGVNKSNYFLRRRIEKAIEFRPDGQISHQLKIYYENTATSSNWPGGEYVNWLRVYLPRETQLESIEVSNPFNPQEKKIIGPEEREEEIKNNKEVIGFLIRVPIKQRRTVTIKFNQKLNFDPQQKRFGYLLYWQKQSGYQSTPLSVLISFPNEWQPLQVNPAASLVSGKLLFNQQLDKDSTFGVEFGQ